MTQIKTLEPDAVSHVTIRVVRGQRLFAPKPEFVGPATGLIRRFQKKHRMRICVLAMPSNHLHLLLHPKSQTQLSNFMRDVDQGIAYLAKRLYGVVGRVLERPFGQSEALDDEAALQAEEYILRNTVKEGLIADPRHWPGIHSAQELCGGAPRVGAYFDRDGYNSARAKDRDVGRERFVVRESIELSPLPQHAALTRYQRETRSRKLVQKIVREEAEVRTQRGDGPPMTAEEAIGQDPLFIPPSRPGAVGVPEPGLKPKATRQRPYARFQARGPHAVRLLRERIEARRCSIKAYYSALASFLDGDPTVEFPDRCYLPHFVRLARGSP